MLLGEPPRTDYDLRFRTFGIPVRVHPLFWVVALVLGIRTGSPQELLIWMGVVFVSIVVHELGHALAARYFGWEPWITLHILGGLASFQADDEASGKRVAVSLAGPAAGFLLAALVVGVMFLSGRPIAWRPGLIFWVLPDLPSENLGILIHYVLWVNIFWGLINLLPVYPLDGGQVARELMTQGNVRDGLVRSMWLGVITGAIVAVWALFGTAGHGLLMTFMFGYLAYLNYQMIQAYSGGGPYGGYERPHRGYDEGDRW